MGPDVLVFEATAAAEVCAAVVVCLLQRPRVRLSNQSGGLAGKAMTAREFAPESGVRLRGCRPAPGEQTSNDEELIDLLQAENQALRQEIDRLSVYRHLAFRDDLTGLYNRRHFEERLGQEWSRSCRFDDALSIVVIDLDDFKAINDTMGHSMGDHVLSIVGKALRSNCREFDVPCRIGGDEFAFILPNTDAEGAQVVVDRVTEVLEASVLPNGVKLSLSFGTAERVGAASPFDLRNRADLAMYANKRKCKNARTVAA